MRPSCLVLAALSLCHGAAANEPLHARIDVLIAAGTRLPFSQPADDAEFLRRAHLDFAGRIPSVDEARAFLADRTPDKRLRLIDRLLDGPDHARRMTEAFDALLMERRPLHPELKERAGHDDEWRRFLHDAFAKNKAYDLLVRQILQPNSDDETLRGAAFFYTRRLEKWGQVPADYPGLTRDVGRLFLGLDLQCAECHDHLFVDDYKQLDFQGLAAFFSPMNVRSDSKFPAVAEKPLEKKTEFASAFTQAKQATGPRLPGEAEVETPVYAKGDEYSVPPDRKTGFPGVPKFSPLAVLAQRLPESSSFARNAANRLWWLLMGRGLVEPLDLHHAANPPSHPELLDLLAKELAEHRFDIKWFLRELAQSETYQRSSLLPAGIDDPPPDRYVTFNERPLTPDQWFWSLLEATGERRLQGDKAGMREGRLDPALAAWRAKFVAAFGNPPKTPETTLAPSVKSALFLLNDETLAGWLRPREDNLAARLEGVADPAVLAEELYLSVFSRFPAEEERLAVADSLANSLTPSDRAKALNNLVWSLLASPEFGANH